MRQFTHAHEEVRRQLLVSFLKGCPHFSSLPPCFSLLLRQVLSARQASRSAPGIHPLHGPSTAVMIMSFHTLTSDLRGIHSLSKAQALCTVFFCLPVALVSHACSSGACRLKHTFNSAFRRRAEGSLTSLLGWSNSEFQDYIETLAASSPPPPKEKGSGSSSVPNTLKNMAAALCPAGPCQGELPAPHFSLFCTL